jgi:aarF domain-containing kinase
LFTFYQLVHYVNQDSFGLANDFHSLGFIPEGTDLHQVADALHASFGASRQSNDFQVSLLPNNIGLTFYMIQYHIP